jgi:hypothetical protein
MTIRSLAFSIILLTLTQFSWGQNEVNQYKYVLVQRQYDFQKSQDSYQINSLMKFLFNRAGFTAVMADDTYPADLAEDPCLALTAVLKNRPSFLTTRVSIDLRDCRNNIVISTMEQRSKEKDFKAAYHEAIRKTFTDLEGLNYTYQPVSGEVAAEEPEKESVPMIRIEEPAKKIGQMEEKEAEKIEVAAVKEVKEEKAVEIAEKEEAKAVEAPKKIARKEKKEAEKKELVIKAAKIEKPKVPEKKPEPPAAKKPEKLSLEGKYEIAQWGVCDLVSENGSLLLRGGTERIVIATVYPTSKPNLYIIKWMAFKEPRLAQLTPSGNLMIDNDKGQAEYKRVNQ